MKSLSCAVLPRVPRLRPDAHVTEGMSSVSLLEKGSLPYFPSFSPDKKELGACLAYWEENIYDNTHESKTVSGMNGRSLLPPGTWSPDWKKQKNQQNQPGRWLHYAHRPPGEPHNSSRWSLWRWIAFTKHFLSARQATKYHIWFPPAHSPMR